MRRIPELFNLNEFHSRQNELQSKLKDIDTSIIFNRADLTYYSSIGLDGIILVDENIRHFVRRNLELAKINSVLNVKEMDSYRIFKEIGKERPLGKLGLELDILPYKTVKYIEKAFNYPEIMDISPILRSIRSIKSKEEQHLMQLAAKQTDEGFEVAAEKIKPGISEVELSAEMEHFFRKQGHPGFVQVRMFHHNYTTPAYVMAGESTRDLNSKFGPLSGSGLCRMHLNGPSRRKFKINDAILIDATGVVEGYTADETRTFTLGKQPQNYLDTLDISINIQEKISGLLVEGNNTTDIYDTIIQFVSETGYQHNFMGVDNDVVDFIGHGVGLELDEFPLISPRFDENLKEGQVIAIEPKFIFNEPPGGIGIEDTWIVGKTRAERITNFPWEI
ncbi:MAG: M24 family metallopeptidase [Candidatus Kariarchaeaceae archaeon]|jgi:Xaa-Pro aminopeptidase